MPVGAAIGVVGAAGVSSYASSRQQNSAARNASREQADAAGQAADAQVEAARIADDRLRQQFQQTVQLQLPRAQAGDTALAQMMGMLGLSAPDSLTSGDAYEQVLYGQTYGPDGATSTPAQINYNPDGTARPGANLLAAGKPDYAAYVDQNPDLAAEYDRVKTQGFGSSIPRSYDANGNGMLDKGEYGLLHDQRFGENRAIPTTGGNGMAAAANANGRDLSISVPGTNNLTEMIQQTPGYQFQFNEGIRAIDSSAASRGRLMSGSSIKRLNELGQGLAGREFGNYYNRLAGIAGVGQTAADTITNAGNMTGNNLANNAMAAGSAQAQGYLNAGNARASSYLNQTSTFGNALGSAAGAGAGLYGSFYGG